MPSIAPQAWVGGAAGSVFSSEGEGQLASGGLGVVPSLAWGFGIFLQLLMAQGGKAFCSSVRASCGEDPGFPGLYKPTLLCVSSSYPPLARGQGHLLGSRPINLLYSLLCLAFPQVPDA